MIRDDWPTGRYQPPPRDRLVQLTEFTFRRHESRLGAKAGMMLAQQEPARQLDAVRVFNARAAAGELPYVLAFDEYGNRWASFPSVDGTPWALVSLESCGLWRVDDAEWYAPDPILDEDLWLALGWELRSDDDGEG